MSDLKIFNVDWSHRVSHVQINLKKLSHLIPGSSGVRGNFNREGGHPAPTPNKSVHSTALPSEAWGGTGSWHHNGSGFTIVVGPGPLLLLMLPLPFTRQLSHRRSGTGSVTPEWKEWITLLVSRSRCRSYFPVNQLIELQYSVLLAAAPALPSPFQGLTHSSARSRGHPIVAVVQYDWTTVCCFDKTTTN